VKNTATCLKNVFICVFLRIWLDVCATFHNNYERFSNRFISLSASFVSEQKQKGMKRHVGFSNRWTKQAEELHLALPVNSGGELAHANPIKSYMRQGGLELVQFDCLGLPNQNSLLLLGGLHRLQDL
jgi:hypothetical protein